MVCTHPLRGLGSRLRSVVFELRSGPVLFLPREFQFVRSFVRVGFVCNFSFLLATESSLFAGGLFPSDHTLLRLVITHTHALHPNHALNRVEILKKIIFASLLPLHTHTHTVIHTHPVARVVKATGSGGSVSKSAASRASFSCPAYRFSNRD